MIEIVMRINAKAGNVMPSQRSLRIMPSDQEYYSTIPIAKMHLHPWVDTSVQKVQMCLVVTCTSIHLSGKKADV